MTPIVLVPGLLCTAEVFAAQITALWPHGPVTVASTLAGDTIAEIATAILQAAPPCFALAGISMGGYISLEIMRQAPERVLKLALLNTSARPDLPEQSAQRRAMIDQARAGAFAELRQQAADTMVHPDRRQEAGLRDTIMRMSLTIGVEGMARQMGAIIARADSRPGLADIRVPTRVLVGDRDPLTPPDCAAEMAAAIPNAQLAVVPACGHVSTLERPDAVNHALIAWLRDQPG